MSDKIKPARDESVSPMRGLDGMTATSASGAGEGPGSGTVPGVAIEISPFNPATGAALAELEAARPAMLARLSGTLPANQMRYACIGCGWDKTLEFDEEEARALEGDLTQYKGPCPKCGGQTLLPYEALVDGAEVEKYADAAIRPDYREMGAGIADGVLDRLESRVLGRQVAARDPIDTLPEGSREQETDGETEEENEEENEEETEETEDSPGGDRE